MKSGMLEEFGTLKAMAPLHVLIVAHSRNDVELILNELRDAGLRLDHTLAENKKQLHHALQQKNFDAILSDYRLPNWTALEALKQLCEKGLRDGGKRTLNALAERETRARHQFAELDRLYRSLPVALAVFGRDMRFLRVNDEISKFDGIPVAAHVGLPIWEVTPDFANAAEGYLRKVFQTGEAVSNIELQGGTLQQPDAMHKWLCNFYPLRGEDGAVSAATVMAIDITDRKRAEEALDLSEARNRDLVEHSIYGISRVPPDGTFLDANPALLTLLGCPP